MVSDGLKSRILEIIQGGAAVSDALFTELALELHAAQRAASPFLDRFYATSGSQARHWSEIPGLPTSAFKRTQVRAFPESRTFTYFQTSGTTEGESGRHYFETLEFYEAAILPNFKSHLLPRGERLPMLILTAPPEEMPNSSLVHMMEVVKNQLGGEGSDYFLREGKLQFDGLLRRIQDFTQRHEPVFLLGTAFAFVHLLDALTDTGNTLALPAGSRIMETGGFKGRSREVERVDFYPMLSAAMGVPLDHIVNEYGMTELSSQFYDVSLAAGKATARKSMPAWTRVLCVDPMTGAPMPDGTEGLIRVYDLANVGSSCVLQTEDVGVHHGSTFEVHGRVPMASPRGCSLAAEQLQTRSL